jgi:hypothetical protein
VACGVKVEPPRSVGELRGQVWAVVSKLSPHTPLWSGEGLVPTSLALLESEGRGRARSRALALCWRVEGGSFPRSVGEWREGASFTLLESGGSGRGGEGWWGRRQALALCWRVVGVGMAMKGGGVKDEPSRSVGEQRGQVWAVASKLTPPTLLWSGEGLWVVLKLTPL